MAKRKDDEDEPQPPSKCLRPSIRVAVARPNDASNPSTSRVTSVASNRPGFRAARRRDASTSQNISVSRITTLVVGASNNRLKTKHIQRRRTPVQPEPAEANLSGNPMPSTSDEAQLHPESDANVNTTPSASSAKLERKRNNNTKVSNFIEALCCFNDFDRQSSSSGFLSEMLLWMRCYVTMGWVIFWGIDTASIVGRKMVSLNAETAREGVCFVARAVLSKRTSICLCTELR